MEPSPFEQSLPICCSLAVIGGILEVGATAVTAVLSVREAEGKKLNPVLYYAALAGNVSLQLTGSLMSHLVATWFGPVSIVVPFFYSATLLSNMVIFGAILGLEFFTKIMRAGTYVIVVSVVLLPVVGPSIQEDQNINELLHHWYAILWFGLLLAAMSITGLVVGFVDITKYSMHQRVGVLLVARASSIAINLTVSRAFILEPMHLLFVFFLVLKIVSGAIYTYAIVVQSTAVDQARFVPLNTTTIIIVNALTGIIIWEDWKVMVSWYGYACVFCLLGLGCDLLLSSSVPLLNEDNPNFGMHKRASMIFVKPRLQRDKGYTSIPNANLDDDDDEEDDENDDENDVQISQEPSVEQPVLRTRREAWAHIARTASIIRTPPLSASLTENIQTVSHSVKESTTAAYTSSVAAVAQTSKAVTTTLSKPVNQVGKAGHRIAHAASDMAHKGKDMAASVLHHSSKKKRGTASST